MPHSSPSCLNSSSNLRRSLSRPSPRMTNVRPLVLRRCSPETISRIRTHSRKATAQIVTSKVPLAAKSAHRIRGLRGTTALVESAVSPVPQRGFSHRTSIASKEDAFTPHDGILEDKSKGIPRKARDEDQGRSRHPRARARESSDDWGVRFRLLPLSCRFCLSTIVQSQSSSPSPAYSPSSYLLRTFLICVYTH